MPVARHLFFALAFALGSTAGHAQSRIENVATLDYRAGGALRTVESNRVVTDIARVKTPTTLQILLPPAGYDASGARCAPDFVPAPVSPATLSGAVRTQEIDQASPLIFVLTDPGGNRDPLARETRPVDIDSGDMHVRVELTETGPDTGIFAGALPAADSDPAVAACAPVFGRDDALTLTFHEDDTSLGSTVALLSDPAGLVFDSRTAALIDGAEVTLLDAAGRPATVFGDDGVSHYPATVVSGAMVTDASGRTYPGRPGRYRFPLSPPGRYTLKIVPPADYTAPSVVALADLATLRAPGGGPFLITDASFGAPLTLTATAAFEADIPLDRAVGTSLLVTKVASVRDASPGDAVQYRITATNRGTVAANGLHLLDTLPLGLRYQKGSARGAAEPVVDGRDLDFTVPTLAVGATAQVQYLVTVAPGAPVGAATNRVHVRGGANSSNEAAATVRIRPLLFTDALTLIGRVSEGDCGDPERHRIGIAGVRLLLEDGTYVVTDRDGLYHFEGVRPGTHVVQLDTASIPATHEAVACDRDTRTAGSAISRFVEGSGGLLKRVDFQLRPTGRVATASAALPVIVADDAAAAGNRDWLAGQTPGTDWLFPAVGHNPRAAVLRVAIKHLPSQRVALSVNGQQTEALAFDGTDSAGDVAVSKWTGLPLVEGDNRLVARILGADGMTVQTLERTVHYAMAAVRATFDAAKSRLIADGLTRPLLAVRVTDASGHPVRAGTLVPFKVDPPYTAAIESELQQARQLAGVERAQSTAHVVGDDGYAFLALQPTTQAGAVRAVVSLAEDRQVRTTELRAWLAAGRQDWVVVGFGSGTLGYDTLDRRAVPGAGGKVNGGKLHGDGQLALYAKGRIKGSWLLTIAYDSKRAYDPERGLLGTIDPDRYYTVYGDGTQQGYDAPTRRKLYLRLERREFYALFGDFETGLNETQLGRYNRTLNGVKAAYEGRRLRANGFVAKTDQRYARDEIQGNGLSGPYRLASHGLVSNSDQVRIEVRDRYRSERIVSSTQLTRHIDYDIDPDAGTLRFREPVLSRDAALNPVFIVVDYEVGGLGAQRLAAAGRAAVRLGRVELGATAIRDETQGRATVLAADVKARIGQATELRGEIATGGRDGIGAGKAWLAEIEHHGRRIDGTLYARQQDYGFGVGQQNLVEAGTRKIGADGRVALTDRLSIAANGWYQQNLAGPGSRVAGEARLEYVRPAGTLYAGVQVASDRGLDRDRDSRLLTLGGSQTLLGGALTLGAEAQFAPGGDRDSVDFPARQQLTASWRVKDGIRLIGGYEIAEGADYTAHTARIGFDVAPWTGAKLTSTLNQQAIRENGARTFAQYGLAQSLTLGKSWTVDATLDAASTLKGRIATGAVLNAFQPVASGGFIGQDQTNGDFTAITLGATYRAARWSWNGRIEYRTADTNTRWGLTSNLLRTLGEGKTLAVALRGYRVTDRGGAVARSVAADVALAWRPLDSDWSILDRLSLRDETAGAGFTAGNVLGVPAYGYGQQDTRRIINNLALNYRTGPEGRGHGFEGTLYYGAKYVAGRYAEERYDGLIDVTGFDLRRDLGPRFDIGVQGSVQHAWNAQAWSFSGGPSAGWSPAQNLWIGAGYNIAGYRDRDFEADRYTRQGPYVTLRMKFDQTSLRGMIP